MQRLFTLIVALAPGMIAAAQGSQWVHFRSPEGRFSAEFPGPPTVRYVPQQTRNGIVPVYATSVAVPGNTRFVVTYTDSSQRINGYPIDQVLNVLADGMFRNKTLTEVSRKLVTFDKKRALNLLIKTSNGTYQFAYLVVSQNRFYSVFVEAPKESQRDADFKRFLGSFRVG